jgi:hypothetical protein
LLLFFIFKLSSLESSQTSRSFVFKEIVENLKLMKIFENFCCQNRKMIIYYKSI